MKRDVIIHYVYLHDASTGVSLHIFFVADGFCVSHKNIACAIDIIGFEGLILLQGLWIVHLHYSLTIVFPVLCSINRTVNNCNHKWDHDMKQHSVVSKVMTSKRSPCPSPSPLLSLSLPIPLPLPLPLPWRARPDIHGSMYRQKVEKVRYCTVENGSRVVPLFEKQRIEYFNIVERRDIQAGMYSMTVLTLWSNPRDSSWSLSYFF